MRPIILQLCSCLATMPVLACATIESETDYDTFYVTGSLANQSYQPVQIEGRPTEQGLILADLIVSPGSATHPSETLQVQYIAHAYWSEDERTFRLSGDGERRYVICSPPQISYGYRCDE